MKVIIWEAPARVEYDDALVVSRNAAEFQNTVNAALHDIASGQVTHALVPRTRTRQCVLTKFPYSIAYAEASTEIRIFAFAHHKRQRGYWKRRLHRN